MKPSNQNRQSSEPGAGAEGRGREGFARRIDCAETGGRGGREVSRAARGRGIREGETWDLSSRADYR